MPSSSSAAGWRLLLLLVLMAFSGVAQEPQARIDFLNEKLPVPDSERFREPEYIDSGVGLTFGVDKRLAYHAGKHEEAAQRFEEAIKRFKYKSEIWVYLARSYFYQQEPEKARGALERAAAAMPDLESSLWQPLLEGLLWEIRKRANQLQVQVDFYSQDQEDFFSLFRLYKFLEAYPEAARVIGEAQAKERKMNELATMASGAGHRAYRKRAKEWGELAGKLRAELSTLGVEEPSTGGTVGAFPTAEDSLDFELIEATRLLQLRVDFYQPELRDYQDLFRNYLRLNQPERAAAAIEALGREIKRVKIKVEGAVDIQEELEFKDKVIALETLQKALRDTLAQESGKSE